MGETVILVECDVADPAGTVTTLRFADRAVAPMAPTDAHRPNAVWDTRLLEPPTIRRQLFGDLQTLEPGFGVGTMVLANADRALDVYQGHVWSEVRVWRWTVGTAFSAARRLITGPAAGTPAFDSKTSAASRVRLDLFDYRMELRRPIQTDAYGGTNAGGAFFDGDGNLKGVLKPLAFGNLMDAHVSPAPVNTSALTYQLHDGEALITSSAYDLQIFDRGGDAGLEFIAGFNGHSDMTTAVPKAALMEADVNTSEFASWLGDGLVRINANLVGQVAFGLKGDAPGHAYVETPGPVLDRVLRRLGVPNERIGASVASAPGAGVVGLFVQDNATGAEVVAPLARAGLLALLPDRSGVWQAVKIAPPVGFAAVTLGDADILSIEGEDASLGGAGEFIVGYDKIYTTYRRDDLQAELQGTEAEVRLGETWRWARTEDVAFKARFPGTWRAIRLETALRQRGHAEALAGQLKALFGLRDDGKPRRQWRVTVEMTDALLDVALGSIVVINAPKLGIFEYFLLTGEEPMRPRRDQLLWTLWG